MDRADYKRNHEPKHERKHERERECAFRSRGLGGVPTRAGNEGRSFAGWDSARFKLRWANGASNPIPDCQKLPDSGRILRPLQSAHGVRGDLGTGSLAFLSMPFETRVQKLSRFRPGGVGIPLRTCRKSMVHGVELGISSRVAPRTCGCGGASHRWRACPPSPPAGIWDSMEEPS